ncbi:GNAT family N-acetyltransferase [Elizabethkingia ursingii]|uniref:GNAT family acetyltransferase n=1 Tax=Elizabethkingia ursingii TaxID=1756150 RepID=A0AAJ3NBW1_9FLAO|nr:GNAT family N-acetyltransferase [Elizabethkingia ursingii]AQX10759.1 GNAT family acetyltransferase [Elizabethkingia ursingii]OPB75092.1 GNAT family acetyltransferase [Elizabethkingia ursingii]
MITINRTDSENKDFQYLIYKLDTNLAERNGEKNDFFAQFNKTNLIQNVIVAYSDNIPVGCGAIKVYDNNTMEVKRMFVLKEQRGKKIAGTILNNLEQWAKELSYNKCILETGDKMPEAIGLYRKSGYKQIPNYGQYENVESSLCFEKIL